MEVFVWSRSAGAELQLQASLSVKNVALRPHQLRLPPSPGPLHFPLYRFSLP